MKTFILIAIVIVGILVILFFPNEQQNTCEQMGGKWNVDHCVITEEMFDSDNLTCDLGPIFENGTCFSNGIKLVIESTP